MKKERLFIWWVLAKKRDDFTDAFEASSMDRGMGKLYDPVKYLIRPESYRNTPQWTTEIPFCSPDPTQIEI